MNEKTLKFSNIKINKKQVHKSKQAIDPDSVTADKIVVSDKFKHSEERYKYFIDYKEDEFVRPLCITYLKWMVTYNILKTAEKTCPF